MKFPKPKQYIVKNPDKYLGNPNNVISRSSLETRFMTWCDRTRYVLKWASEETIVPYISPVDMKEHRYFVDFSIVIQTPSGSKKLLVEIKPKSQCLAPTITPRKRQTTIINEHKTYAVNQAKWQAAKYYAKMINAEFVVFTEEDLT